MCKTFDQHCTVTGKSLAHIFSIFFDILKISLRKKSGSWRTPLHKINQFQNWPPPSGGPQKNSRLMPVIVIKKTFSGSPPFHFISECYITQTDKLQSYNEQMKKCAKLGVRNECLISLPKIYRHSML